MGEWIKAFASIGFVTTLGICILVIVLVGDILIERFKEWRAYKCKIKCLCKHKYKLEWLSGNGIARLKCSNCGKKKQMIIDIKSFEVFFGRISKW